MNRFLVWVAIVAPLFAPVVSYGQQDSVTAVLAVCGPVISDEYRGDNQRWGECIAATKAYLKLLYGPPTSQPEPDTHTAGLVSALFKLYQSGVECKAHETELPHAIALASEFSRDPNQVALLLQIGQSMAACDEVQTGTTDVPDQINPSPDD